MGGGKGLKGFWFLVSGFWFEMDEGFGRVERIKGFWFLVSGFR
jgi:hypothetical protein